MKGPLWGGRFKTSPAPSMAEFSSSLSFDVRLWQQDIDATRAHAGALERAGILSEEEIDGIRSALDEAERLFADDRFEFDPSDEDIHSAIERYLISKLGDTGAKIHAGRSRNDLVATDLRLWLKTVIPKVANGIYEVEHALYRHARAHVETLAPGYTHLQRAQPVALAHHLLAHAFALTRDFERVIAAFRRCDVSPLGAAAFAGTTLPIDPVATAAELGFSKVFDNSADAVGDRDFALEFLSAGAILATHLSRTAEEIVLWTTSEFRFATLDDSYSTGSSIMPHKKNPDFAELVRARTARVTANLVHLLGVMKGLPLAYNRDLQEDKEPVFDTADTLLGMLSVLRGGLLTISFNVDALETAASDYNTVATDLAESLVVLGVPFREAHEAVGKLVRMASEDGTSLLSMPADRLREAHPRLDVEMLLNLQARRSVEARNSHGGPAPERIAEQIRRLENVLDDQERWLAGFNTN